MTKYGIEGQPLPTPEHYSCDLKLAQLVLRIFEKISHEIVIDEQSVENLATFNEYLKNGQGIMYGNHTSMKDVALAPFIKLALPNFNNALVLTAQKMVGVHFRNPISIVTAPVIKIAKPFGIIFVPVPQTAQDKQIRGGNDLLKKYALAKESAMQIPGNVIAIAPEGTRSKNGLQKFKPGLGREALSFPDTPIIAVASTYVDDEMIVRFGRPQTARELIPKLVEQYDQYRDQETPENKLERKALYQKASDFFHQQMADLLSGTLHTMRTFY